MEISSGITIPFPGTFGIKFPYACSVKGRRFDQAILKNMVNSQTGSDIGMRNVGQPISARVKMIVYFRDA
jgi:hypothetical protein